MSDASLGQRSFRRAAALRAAIRTPADAWLAARMLAWRVALPALKRILPLPRLVRLMSAHPRRGRRPAREQQVAYLARKLSGPGGDRRLDNCLERSLVTYRYLSALGSDPRLVVGVAEDGEVRGHVWVTLAGRPLHEHDDPLERFSPVVTFGRGGVAES